MYCLDLYNKSRMSREVQVRFCERLEGQFLRPTRRQTVVVHGKNPTTNIDFQFRLRFCKFV